MFGITCIAILWLTILGADYVKNKSRNNTNIKVYDVKIVNGKPVRMMSLFNIGKKIFQTLYNTYSKYKLKFNFILYVL